jgi:hypothetical protein
MASMRPMEPAVGRGGAYAEVSGLLAAGLPPTAFVFPTIALLHSLPPLSKYNIKNINLIIIKPNQTLFQYFFYSFAGTQ